MKNLKKKLSNIQVVHDRIKHISDIEVNHINNKQNMTRTTDN